MEKVDAYPWSSHHACTGRNNPLGLVDTDQVLRLFLERKYRARAKYRAFMAGQDTLDKANVYATIDQRLLGDDEFVERVMVLLARICAGASGNGRPCRDWITLKNIQTQKIGLPYDKSG